MFTWLKAAPGESCLVRAGAPIGLSQLCAEGIQGRQMLSGRQDVGEAVLVRVVQVVQDEVEHAIIQEEI